MPELCGQAAAGNFFHRVVVVVAEPDAGDVIRREAEEPGIAIIRTRARLARRGTIQRGAFAGALIIEYSVDALVRHFVPADVSQRHMISVLDEKQRELAATVTTSR